MDPEIPGGIYQANQRWIMLDDLTGFRTVKKLKWIQMQSIGQDHQLDVLKTLPLGCHA